MDEFIKGLVGVIEPPWNYVFGIAALLIVVVPRLLDFHHGWVDIRQDRRQLELEKLRLEILKLRTDLQQAAELRHLPEVSREVEAIPAPPPAVVVPPTPTMAAPPASAPARHGGIKGVLARYPRVGKPVLWIVQIVMAYLTLILAAAAVGLPFLGWGDPEIGGGLSIFLAVMYAALAWLSYRGFLASRTLRRELVTP